MKGRIVVNMNEPIATINPNIYGHFAEHLGTCIYEGLWVGPDSAIPNTDGLRSDVISALRRLRPPIIRWPGGCFADDYHWRDGIGPRESRPKRVNTWWGNTIEDNSFGTHEFLTLCTLIGATPYIVGNVGSGSPRELRDWVEYCNYPSGTTLSDERAANGALLPFGVRYWGVGNENWGCGGNMCPEDYAAAYKRYATYVRNYGTLEPFKIACGPAGNNTDWTHRFFDKLGKNRDLSGYAAHYYCGTAGTATEYSDDQWYELLSKASRIEDLIVQQRAIMDGYDPERKIGLIIDEWGTWHPAEEGRNPRFLWQQNTLRDALVAALSLDLFNRHADKVVMANIAQTVNVLQAMVLTEGDKMITTPTYEVYRLYQHHQGRESVLTRLDIDDIHYGQEDQETLSGLYGSASVGANSLALTVVNPHVSEPVEAWIRIYGGVANMVIEDVLTADDIHAHNTFDDPKRVTVTQAEYEKRGSNLRHVFPPASVTLLRYSLE